MPWITIDDLALPSPTELEAYARVNPEIVKFLLETSQKEQKHRHQMDAERLRLLANSGKVEADNHSEN